MRISGNIVDVVARDIYPGTVSFGETVTAVEPGGGPYDTYLVPGYIDAHIHIESTMLMPAAFSWCVAPHGTAAVVADPHEIANVCGMDGIALMMKDAQRAYADIYFAAPSCVPASPFETSGATLGPDEIRSLLSLDRVVALGEMMNYPGVIAGDPDCRAKLAAAREAGNPVDGHCPGLSGQALAAYVSAGPSTEHECTTLDEAREKASAGLRILIREGSSARNLSSLIGLEEAFAFCTDDRHVGDLLARGHMDHILSLAVAEGKDPVDALRMATWNPARHYGLSAGEIAPGRPAHLLVLGTLTAFTPRHAYHRGRLVAKGGTACVPLPPAPRPVRVMKARNVTSADLAVPPGWRHHAIGAVDGSLVTAHLRGHVRGWQKLVVADRYGGLSVSACYVDGFGMEKCALAQTIAHDSHNIVATGSSDTLLLKAMKTVSAMGGGIAACDDRDLCTVALEVAGLMSTRAPGEVARDVRGVHRFLSAHGVTMDNAVTTLSFMALPVIPHLKLTDRGLVDVDTFSFMERAEGAKDQGGHASCRGKPPPHTTYEEP